MATTTSDTTKVLIVGSTSVERISLNNLVQSATINADSLNGTLGSTIISDVASNTTFRTSSVSITRNIVGQVGRVLAGDSTLFADNAVLLTFPNELGDTIVIDSIVYRMAKTGADITIQGFVSDTAWSATAPDSLDSGGLNLTTTGGLRGSETTFTGSGIVLNGEVFWLKVLSSAIKPDEMSITVLYHIQ